MKLLRLSEDRSSSACSVSDDGQVSPLASWGWSSYPPSQNAPCFSGHSLCSCLLLSVPASAPSPGSEYPGSCWVIPTGCPLTTSRTKPMWANFTLKCEKMKLLILKEHSKMTKAIFRRGREPVPKSQKGKTVTIFPINLQCPRIRYLILLLSTWVQIKFHMIWIEGWPFVLLALFCPSPNVKARVRNRSGSAVYLEFSLASHAEQRGFQTLLIFKLGTMW